MGRGRRPAAAAAPARPPAPLEPARLEAPDPDAVIARVVAEVGRDMLLAMLNTLEIGSLEELPKRLRRGEDPERPPKDLLNAASLAQALGLTEQARELLGAAAAAYAAHADRYDKAAARPRTRDDQRLLAKLGVDWRLDDRVAAQAQRNRASALALAEVAAGRHEAGELSPSLWRSPQFRRREFDQEERIREALGEPIAAALTEGELERARQLMVGSLRALGSEDLARQTERASQWSLEVASRIVRAGAEIGEPGLPDWADGIAHLGQQDLDRLGLDRLAGQRAEAQLRPQVAHSFTGLPPATGVRTFEGQVRRILEHPDRYHHSHGASKGGEHAIRTINVPVADAASFGRIARHYADHPAFAGYGIVATLLGGQPKSDLSVAFRLVFADEQAGGERREIWGMLGRATSGARTLEGRARACALAELGLTKADISFMTSCERAPISSYYSENPNVPRTDPVRLPLADVLRSEPPVCTHRAARWSATSDGDALRLGCPQCDRMALALVPRHRLPDQRIADVPALAPVEEDRYLARARLHAILAGGTETAASVAEMRARDGVVQIRPNGVGAAIAGSSRSADLRSAFAGRR